MNYVAQRLVVSAFVLLGISIMLFAMLQLMPGDPVEMMFDPNSFVGDRDAAIAARRAELGLDQSLPAQYLAWMSELLRGNLGFSYGGGRPVAEIMAERIGPTLRLTGAAMFIGLAVGIPVGVVAAFKRNTAVDYLAAGVSLTAISVPGFFLGLIGLYVFGLRLEWLPIAGMATTGGSGGLVDFLRHLLLPAGILGLSLAGPYVRYARSSVLDVLSQEFLTTARSKGLRTGRVVTQHALRNALIPLVSVIAVQLPLLVAGAVVIEQVFAWPGMGTMALDAISSRDHPLLLGFALVVAVAVLLANLAADLLYAVIDPRIRLEGTR